MATPTMKALKTEHATSVHSTKAPTMCDVMHLEMVMQRVLLALPLVDLHAFLSVCGKARDLSWLLHDAALWEELLKQHFGGRREVIEEPDVPVDEAEEDDEEDDEDEDEDVDEEDNDSEEDDDHDQEDIEDDMEELEEQEEQEEQGEEMSGASRTPALVPDTKVDSTDDVKLETGPATSPPTPVDVPFPAWFDAALACVEATEFVVSACEWQRFQQRIHIVRGDFATITDIDSHAIDAFAFPGNNILRNPYNGAAHVMFNRAGRALEEHTRNLGVQLRPGQSHVTPGFNTGARVLIHCHGPFMGVRNVFPTLARTYRSVLQNAMDENAECLALTSISTGNFGVPIPEATKTAMQTIHSFLRLHHAWQGHIGVVCYEGDVFQAFSDERDTVLAAFNATTP